MSGPKGARAGICHLSTSLTVDRSVRWEVILDSTCTVQRGEPLSFNVDLSPWPSMPTSFQTVGGAVEDGWPMRD